MLARGPWGGRPRSTASVDGTGPWAVFVVDDEELLSSPGVRWRFVADVGTRDEGLDLLETDRALNPRSTVAGLIAERLGTPSNASTSHARGAA
jgi:hypothetical protein